MSLRYSFPALNETLVFYEPVGFYIDIQKVDDILPQ